LYRYVAGDYRLSVIEFEKDDDTNFHMDAIAGLSNMRARNYSVPEVGAVTAVELSVCKPFCV
jgi:ubiquitin-activating enzyme E1